MMVFRDGTKSNANPQLQRDAVDFQFSPFFLARWLPTDFAIQSNLDVKVQALEKIEDLRIAWEEFAPIESMEKPYFRTLKIRYRASQYWATPIFFFFRLPPCITTGPIFPLLGNQL